MPPNTSTFAPPSPPVFVDFSATPHEQPQNDSALDYISRMLMEEDMVDKYFYDYPDNLTILQAQQPFAQILSTSAASSSSAQESTALIRLDSNENNPASLNITNSMDPNITLSPSEGSYSMHMLSSMAFFKGMEDAKRFLPTENGIMDSTLQKNQIKRDVGTEADLGRSCKQMAVEEQAAACEMLDNLMLNVCPIEKEELHANIGGKIEAAAKKSIRKKAPRGSHSVKKTMVVADLHKLLIRCAEAMAGSDQRSATELLGQIKQQSSQTGTSTQRLAHYFAKGLEARLAGTGSRLYRSLMEQRTCLLSLARAYHLHMTVCCFLKVAFLFSNKTIYNAVMGRTRLHIVNYGTNDGFQWPDLLQWLAEREGGPPHVRITSIDTPQPGLRPAERIEAAGRRVSCYAAQHGVPFEFRAIAAKLETVRTSDLGIDPDEVLVVNTLFCIKSLIDESVLVDMVNPRDQVLNTIRKLKPSVFIHGDVNGSYSAALFMTRFRQALYNFTAQFDMIEAIAQHDNDNRMLVEREIFARSAMNIIACEGMDRVERPHDYRETLARNKRAGLRQLPLDPGIVRTLKDVVKNAYHKHFMVMEEDRWLQQGWKGRVLYTLSTWAAHDDSSSDHT